MAYKYAVVVILFVLSAFARADIVLPISITASPINVSMMCSRQSGVSPLGVVCSAVGTTSGGVTSAPFHDIQYSWNFGDTNTTAAGTCGTAPVAGEGYWRCGSNPGANSKNTAKGPIAAHVYEITEGSGTQTFTVTLTAYDGTNTATQTQTITVTDPATVYAGALTICYKNAAGSTDAACPAGGTVTGSTSAFSVASCTAGVRCLWKRGDTFTSTEQTISASGAVSLGAYGSGAQPIISRTTENNHILILGSNNIVDLRITDLDLTAAGTSSSDTGTCVSIQAKVKNVTLLRLQCHDIGRGFIITGFNSMTKAVVQDSNIYNIGGPGAVGIFGYYTQSAILGNSIGPFAVTAEHNVRIQPGFIVTVANNLMTTPGNTGRLPFTLRAGGHYVDAGSVPNPDTQYVHIADNKMMGGGTASQIFQIGPTNTTVVEWITDTISERNWMVFGAVGAQGRYGQSVNATVRNNICDASDAAVNVNCFYIAPNNLNSPVPDNNRFYNNTCYASDASTTAVCVEFDGSIVAVTNAVMYNNLSYTPNATTARLHKKSGTVTETPTCTTACTYNTSDTDAKSTDPFNGVLPTTPATFLPAGSSYAIGGGTSVPVWSDFFGTAWSPTWSLGAVHP